MAPTEEHRIMRRKQNTLSIDRLSDLPDSVLCHILSFLQTKFSVRTSILAQRWRYLWSYVLTLDFHSENQEIINRIMLLRKVQRINTFRLGFEIGWTAYQLETWVTFAIMHGVQKLDLCLKDREDLTDLPQCLFTCKTLVDLRLDSWRFIPVNGAVCLPRLKILHLLYIQYEADESLPQLLSGCPMLEELKMELLSDMVCCNISSPTIKRLVLDFVAEGNGGRSEMLVINTPALECLKLKDSFSDHIKCGVLNSLTKAHITLFNDEILYFRSLPGFLDRLCNVKYLKLDFSYCPAIIDSVLSGWTTSFSNLTKLKLTGDCRFLSKLLENADNLEILLFSQQFCEKREGWTEPPHQVPTCLLLHLRVIKLLGIAGKEHEFEYIRYFLRNAKVLKRMEISYSFFIDSEEKIDVLEKISRFQRGSTACEVDFVGSRW